MSNHIAMLAIIVMLFVLIGNVRHAAAAIAADVSCATVGGSVGCVSSAITGDSDAHAAMWTVRLCDASGSSCGLQHQTGRGILLDEHKASPSTTTFGCAESVTGTSVSGSCVPFDTAVASVVTPLTTGDVPVSSVTLVASNAGGSALDFWPSFLDVPRASYATAAALNKHSLAAGSGATAKEFFVPVDWSAGPLDAEKIGAIWSGTTGTVATASLTSWTLRNGGSATSNKTYFSELYGPSNTWWRLLETGGGATPHSLIADLRGGIDSWSGMTPTDYDSSTRTHVQVRLWVEEAGVWSLADTALVEYHRGPPDYGYVVQPTLQPGSFAEIPSQSSAATGDGVDTSADPVPTVAWTWGTCAPDPRPATAAAADGWADNVVWAEDCDGEPPSSPQYVRACWTWVPGGTRCTDGAWMSPSPDSSMWDPPPGWVGESPWIPPACDIGYSDGIVSGILQCMAKFMGWMLSPSSDNMQALVSTKVKKVADDAAQETGGIFPINVIAAIEVEVLNSAAAGVIAECDVNVPLPEVGGMAPEGNAFDMCAATDQPAAAAWVTPIVMTMIFMAGVSLLIALV